jgi:hypothetical protein
MRRVGRKQWVGRREKDRTWPRLMVRPLTSCGLGQESDRIGGT